MATTLVCPEEAELLALAAGEEPSEELSAHLSRCPKCPGRLERLKAELAELREGAPGAPLSPATASGPAAVPATRHGQADHPGATATRPPSDSSETRSSSPATDSGLTGEPGDIHETDLPAAIGKYLVIGRFPRTGQADVFRVVHPGLGKDLVLKLALEPVRPDGRCEIIEEGKILAELKHPNLVQVFDLDFHDDRPYLFWISSDGKVAPLYPWKDHDWSQRPRDEHKVKDAELPGIFDEVLDIPVSAPGMETLVLLAREQTPLPRGDEDKLAQLLAGASTSSALDLDKPIWIEDGEEVAFEPSVAGGKDRSGDDALTRGIPSPKARKSDDPVLRIRALLNEKVKPSGSYSQAVLFPNQGGS